MHGDEDTLGGDSGYIGAEKRPDAITRNRKGKKIRDGHGYSQKIIIYYRFIGTLNDECFTK